MPSNLNKAKQYASKRAQAERNVKSHIDTILSQAAEDIAKEAQRITLVSSDSLFRQVVGTLCYSIIEAAEERINAYIREYSKASIAILGDKDTGATGRLLNSELFGKTFVERSHTYMQYFLDDVIKIIIAARRQKMSQSAIENVVKSQYQDPYTNGVIDQAKRKGANIQIPSYGHGIYHSAYGNIVRNAQGVIAIAWGREEKNYAKRNGAIGFRIHRGSTYPCPICDDASVGIHKLTDTVPPLHVNCVCYVEYIYENQDD